MAGKYTLVPPSDPTANPASASPDASTGLGPDPGWFEDLPRTLTYSWVEKPLTALGQYVGNTPGIGPAIQRNTPQAFLDFMADEKARARGTRWQRQLEDAATIANPLYKFLRYLGPVAEPILGVNIGSALQPIEHYDSPEDFWRQVGVKMAGSGITSAGLQRVKGQEERRRSGQAWEDYDKASAAAQAKEATDKAAATKALEGSTKQWEANRNKALADREAQQKAENAAAAQRAKDAQKAVPRQTSQEWWGRTLDTINARDQLPDLDWQSGAKIQKIIGERLNTIRRQMNFPRSRLGDLNAVRQRTEQWIDSPNRAGFNELYEQYVVNPLIAKKGERPVEITGQFLSDYISSMSAKAQSMLREAARPNNPRASELYQQSWGLRQVQNAIERIAAEGDPALLAELQTTKGGYSMWSIGDAAMQPEWGGVADPADLIRVWKGREGGASRYARADQDPRNLATKRWLDQQRAAHQEGAPPQPNQVPPAVIPRPPTAVPVRPTARPTPPTTRRPLSVPPAPSERPTGSGVGRVGALALMDLLRVPWWLRYPVAALARFPSAKKTLDRAYMLSQYPVQTGAAIGQFLQGSPAQAVSGVAGSVAPAVNTIDELLKALQGPPGPEQ